MKKLTRYILIEHIAPFFFAFLTITFLLLIDYVPRILDHVIDKDISIWVALELVVLNLAWMLALSVPMSVLVAVLMAFGRLTSDHEITAIKASGINLIRIIIPLLVAGGVITFGMIQFNDLVLPDLNKKARHLFGDIAAMRPTLKFRSGIFITDIPGYLVLIDHIDHKTSRVEGVRITQTKDKNKPKIIVAEYGYMKMLDNNRTMQFTLYNGEIHELDIESPENYQRIDFDAQVINIEEAKSELKRTDSEYRTDREMGLEQMQGNVDRARVAMMPFRENIDKSLQGKADYLFADTFAFPVGGVASVSAAEEIVKRDAEALWRSTKRNADQIDAQQRIVNKYSIEIYKKYSIPAASLSFILIGVPLAVMTRRSGMGVAIAISILVFVIYWAFLIGGEDLADRGLVSPFWSMWSANFLIGAIGLYLLYKVVTEKPVFAWFRQFDRKRHDKAS
jgi:lipopolysaccharide export system permease protein